MQLMKEGAKWELYIPSELGYGDSGAGGAIPGGAVLVFTLELLKVRMEWKDRAMFFSLEWQWKGIGNRFVRIPPAERCLFLLLCSITGQGRLCEGRLISDLDTHTIRLLIMYRRTCWLVL